MSFEILFQDEFLVAINKPEKMLVHRSNISRQDSVFVMQELRNQLGRHVFPIHRLDRATSGILLFALDSDSAANLAAQFEERSVKKAYWLLCRGFTPEQGEIDYPLTPKDDFKSKNKKKGVVAKVKEAQEAVTVFKRLSTFELEVEVDKYPTSRYSLVEAWPKTGRKHQLRRHFKHISHPIIGDARYGKSTHNHFFAKEFNCDRLCLHARYLEFAHPATNETIAIECAPSGDFGRMLDELGFERIPIKESLGFPLGSNP